MYLFNPRHRSTPINVSFQTDPKPKKQPRSRLDRDCISIQHNLVVTTCQKSFSDWGSTPWKVKTPPSSKAGRLQDRFRIAGRRLASIAPVAEKSEGVILMNIFRVMQVHLSNWFMSYPYSTSLTTYCTTSKYFWMFQIPAPLLHRVDIIHRDKNPEFKAIFFHCSTRTFNFRLNFGAVLRRIAL